MQHEHAHEGAKVSLFSEKLFNENYMTLNYLMQNDRSCKVLVI